MARPKTFLLVEDDLNDAYLIQREFREASHLQLEVVRDGVEAVEYLLGHASFSDRGKHPLPDVILLDLKMPRMDGFDFLRWLRSEGARDVRLTPVIVMTSSNLATDVRNAYASGANAFMSKPIDWAAFKRNMQALGIFWSQIAHTPMSTH